MHDIAVIGAGRIGRIHARNAIAEPGLSLRYIVDPLAEAAAALAAETSAETASLDEVLVDQAVAGIVVASSTDTHLDFSIAALQAGKAVFCEKPIDLDLERARAAGAILGAPEARLFMGFNRRFDPSFRDLQARLATGEMGTLETLHIISHDPAPPPVEYVKVSGGLFRDMTIHDFDMARWLLGEEPVEVYAAGAALVDPAIAAAGDIDTAKILLRTATGRICVISNSRRSGYGYDQRIEAFCSRGLIRAGNVSATTVETWSESGPSHAPFQNFFLDRYAAAYRAEMRHFADMIETGARPLIGYDDAIRALAIGEAANASARERRMVRLD
ncbi:MAG: inositol 2-dehydrogenase [Sphingomonas sp.]|nr:inositol 2-dehydrogenase [Sphingomonas sp.]